MNSIDWDGALNGVGILTANCCSHRFCFENYKMAFGGNCPFLREQCRNMVCNACLTISATLSFSPTRPGISYLQR